MTTETRTPEQQNEHEAKAMLAGALNSLLKRTRRTLGELEQAIKVLQNVESALDSIPSDLDADSIDLAEVAKAVRSADDEGVEHLYLRSIQDDISRINRDIQEAVGQVDYLEAGDFSE